MRLEGCRTNTSFMQASTYCGDKSNISLGERRGQSELARFSLESGWARGVSNSARSWAYPSPPMSGSPPLPPRRNPEFDDRTQGSLGVPRDASHWPASQNEIPGSFRPASAGPSYQVDPQPSQYSSFHRIGDVPVESSPYQYQQQQQQRPAPPHMAPLPMYPLGHGHPSDHIHEPERFPIANEPGYPQKGQRKTKGHVASACVPCKRAHLRCDAQRPCSRCIGNGKEEACIDVQHKKRGRPRLRDEREQRFDNLRQTFSPQPTLFRRPASLYPLDGSLIHSSEGPSRPGTYRVLKSHSTPSSTPRFLEHASLSDAMIYAPQMTQASRPLAAQELPYAYLTMDFQISVATRAFCEILGMTSPSGRNLADVVVLPDREKVRRMRDTLNGERQEREPQYLPPIYGKAEEERVIQSIKASVENFHTPHQEVLNFQDSGGQPRNYQVRLGLAKEGSIYFVALIVVIPAPLAAPQEMYQVPSSAYHPRDAGYGFRPLQQTFAPPSVVAGYSQYPAQYGETRMHEPQMGFRPPPPPLPSSSTTNSDPIPGIPSFSQSLPRAEYSQVQNPREIPRSEPSQLRPLVHRQSELRLPPIQNQQRASSTAARGDDRGGRVDIGGLLENPEPERRQS